MVGSVVWGLLLSSLAGGSTVIGGLVGVRYSFLVQADRAYVAI